MQQIQEISHVAIEELVIDGTGEDGSMEGVLPGERLDAPFAVFSPTLQCNVGGPYAKYKHAEQALNCFKSGKMLPYTQEPVIWTFKGEVHRLQS